jgi:tetratricopeptide (TPR) repeat protein
MRRSSGSPARVSSIDLSLGSKLVGKQVVHNPQIFTQSRNIIFTLTIVKPITLIISTLLLTQLPLQPATALPLQPTITIAQSNPTAADFIAQGDAKYKSGDNAGAIGDYNRALAIDAQNTEAYTSRGIAKSTAEDKIGAIQDFDKAIALNPRIAELYNIRAVTKYESGAKQAAIADYDRAIALKPELALAYLGRSIAKYEFNDKKGSIQDMTKAAELFKQQGNTEFYQKAMKYLNMLQNQ